MEPSAGPRWIRCTGRPISPVRISTSTLWSLSWPSCRSWAIPERCGTTRSAPTCSAAWSRSRPACPWTGSFAERIFQPLHLKDTFFEVPSGKRGRFTGYYARLPSGAFRLNDSPDSGSFTRRPKLLSGGGGLVSSASDYLRFAQMILNGGELDGVRLLRPETVAQMIHNQLADSLVPIRVGG